ncbi:MAG: hypothetical protein WC586_10300 [Methanoregula sp.]
MFQDYRNRSIPLPLNVWINSSRFYSASSSLPRLRFSSRFDEKIKVEGDFIRFRQSLNHIREEIGKAIAVLNNEVKELKRTATQADTGLAENVSRISETVSKEMVKFTL